MHGQILGRIYNLSGDAIQAYDNQGNIVRISCCESFCYDDKSYKLDGERYDIGTLGAPIIVVTKDEYDHFRSIGHGLIEAMAYLADDGKAHFGRKDHPVQTIYKEDPRGKIIRVYPTNDKWSDPNHTTIVDG